MLQMDKTAGESSLVKIRMGDMHDAAFDAERLLRLMWLSLESIQAHGDPIGEEEMGSLLHAYEFVMQALKEVQRTAKLALVPGGAS